jgi:hypothetical protein
MSCSPVESYKLFRKPGASICKEIVSSYEKVAQFYQTIRCHIPEESYLYRFTSSKLLFHKKREFSTSLWGEGTEMVLRRGADKSLAFPISYLQHNQIMFLGWVKEARTTKS